MSIYRDAEWNEVRELHAEIARLQAQRALDLTDHDNLYRRFDYLLDEIDRLRSENEKHLIAVQQWGVEVRRLRAILDRLHKLFDHIEGINDERDSVPILLEARRILREGK